MNKFIFTFALFATLQSFSQTITMDFPTFAGKTYDFVIFQGSKAEKVVQDTIANGKFKRTIPKDHTLLINALVF